MRLREGYLCFPTLVLMGSIQLTITNKNLSSFKIGRNGKEDHSIFFERKMTFSST